jgi:hypothetical protein
VTVSAKRTNQKEEVAVETVPSGWGPRKLVNAGDDFAGTGTPSQKGWEWTIQPELAPPSAK